MTFTGAILPMKSLACEQDSFVMLNLRGDPVLFPGPHSDPDRFVLSRSGVPMARLCASARAHRSWLLCAAHGAAVSIERHGAGTRAQSCLVDGIRPPELRSVLHSRIGR